MPDVLFPLFGQILSHELVHLVALEKTISWAHPDLMDNLKLQKVSCLFNCPSSSPPDTVDQLPIFIKFGGSKPMIFHFDVCVRRKDELE